MRTRNNGIKISSKARRGSDIAIEPAKRKVKYNDVSMIRSKQRMDYEYKRSIKELIGDYELAGYDI